MTPTLPGTLTMVEALRVLGLPDDPNAPLPVALTLRKAYVRAIKRYSPESNPQAFQQVRAAYELLEEQRRWATLSADAIDEEADDAVETIGGDVPTEPAPDVPARPSDGPRPPEAKVPDLPPWHATVGELAAILTDAGVMQDGVKPHASIPAESRERLRSLLWLGWPEELDAPLVRLTARLFELGHEFDGHLLLERLEAAPDHERLGRAAYSDGFHSRVAGIVRSVNTGDGRPELDWIYSADVAAAPPEGESDVLNMSPRTKQLLKVLLCTLAIVVVRLMETSSSGTTRPSLNLSSWIQDTCRRYPAVCVDVTDFVSVLEGGHCGRIVPELASLGAVLSGKLSAIDAAAVTRRAKEAARTVCPTELAPASPPKEASR